MPVYLVGEETTVALLAFLYELLLIRAAPALANRNEETKRHRRRTYTHHVYHHHHHHHHAVSSHRLLARGGVKEQNRYDTYLPTDDYGGHMNQFPVFNFEHQQQEQVESSKQQDHSHVVCYRTRHPSHCERQEESL